MMHNDEHTKPILPTEGTSVVHLERNDAGGGAVVVDVSPMRGELCQQCECYHFLLTDGRNLPALAAGMSGLLKVMLALYSDLVVEMMTEAKGKYQRPEGGDPDDR